MLKLLAVLYPLSYIIDDMIGEYPALCKPLMDDLYRLNQLVKNRGESILTVDLPKLGKLYDRGFQTGILDLKDLPHTLGSERKENEIFSVLLRQTYRRSGELVYPEPRIVFYTRCILYAYKKLSRDSSDTAKIYAVQDFLKIEEGLSEPSRPWNSEGICLLDNGRLDFRDFALSNSDDILLSILTRIGGVLGFNRSPDIRIFKFKHGPGAVSDKSKLDDKYNHITWPIRASEFFPYSTCAMQEGLFRAQNNLLYNENIAANLIVSSISNIKISCSSFSEASGYQYVNESAKLIAVPKTVDKPRLIASEPTANQFLQQGLLKWMRDNMHPTLRLSIDFLSQEESRTACLKASLDNSTATVDLSAASDRMSCKVVERIFSSNEDLLQLLYATRTSLLTDSVSNSFKDLSLKKFAAMGSAVTFPVQTILYAMCVYTAIIYDDNLQINKRTLKNVARKVRVFGDDIIMPSTSVVTLDRLLTLLELKVNVKKTFTRGPFRESCGMDAYLGTDVTPCYIRTDCPNHQGKDLQSWIDVSNNAYRKQLNCLATGMIHMIPSHFLRRMYYHSSASDGFSVLSDHIDDNTPVEGKSISIKYDNDFQQWTIPSLRVRLKSDVCTRENIFNLTQYFTEEPDPLFPWELGYGKNVYARKITRAWVYPKG